MIRKTKYETNPSIPHVLMNVIKKRYHKIPPFWAIWDIYIMLVDAIKEDLKYECDKRILNDSQD